jgi:NAD(P)H-dependent FMN reductase
MTTSPTLLVVIASTRPGRLGLPIGGWFADHVRADGRFVPDVVDLAELALPMLDEPNHPTQQRYEHDHTRAWSARVDAADAVVLVMPEYNHSFTAPLKNALDYLHVEWNDKSVGYVSYGGVSAGLRAVQAVKPVLTALGMHPLPGGVHLAFPWDSMDEGRFVASPAVVGAADSLLGALATWVDRLAVR